MNDAKPFDTPPAEAPSAPPNGARFLGDERVFWRLLTRGAFLLLVTLGIYRFWLATDVRRFLWSNTEIAGDGLEYIGTARELLLGFLIAIALLVPLNMVFFLAAFGSGWLSQIVRAARADRAGAARAIRGLSRAALPAHPHGLSRHPLPPDRLGLALCHLCDLLVGDDRNDARACLSVRAGEPRALQAAQHLLRRSAGTLRRIGHAARSFVACCSGSSWSCRCCSV